MALEREIGALIENLLQIEINSPEEDLLNGGILDSLSLIQLLAALEEHFYVRIPLESLEIDEIRTVQSIGRLVQSLRLAAVAHPR